VRAALADAVEADVDHLCCGQGIDVVVGAELEAGVLRIAVESNLTCRIPQPRGELHKLSAGNVVHGQLAFLFSECLVLPVPANGDPVSAEDGSYLRREKTVASEGV
jgi:hypothetical protein